MLILFVIEISKMKITVAFVHIYIYSGYTYASERAKAHFTYFN